VAVVRRVPTSTALANPGARISHSVLDRPGARKSGRHGASETH
jgi:hypothetical protein